MLELALQADGQRVIARDLAQRANVPKAFLHKIVADLARAGLVRAYQGPTGGLILGQEPTSISMLDILEAIDGPVCMNICLLRPHECPRDRTCPAHTFWGRVQAMVLREMQTATLDQLVEQAHALRHQGRQLEEISYIYPPIPT